MKNSFSFYSMEKNSILGSCLAIVYHASNQEVVDNGLTSSDVSIYIKTLKSLDTFNLIEDIKSKELFDDQDIVVLRVASECQFGVFGDSHCDCESQRQASLRYISKHQGVYVHLPQEAQGRGLCYKARELQLQVKGRDQSGEFVGKKTIGQAAEMLLGSTKVDIRKFSFLKNIFDKLGLNRYRYLLISSNPQKVSELSQEIGVMINSNKDVLRDINIDNIGEYLSKLFLKSFFLDREDLRKIYEIILSADYIPERASTVLFHIEDAIKAGRDFGLNEDILKKMVKENKTKDASGYVGLFEDINKSRREFQIELKVDDSNLDKIFSSGIINGVSSLAFEQNFFYTLGYLNGVRSQDLKIRRRCKVNPRSKDRVLDDTIVYKLRMNDGTYIIRDMIVKDTDLANLIIYAFKTYEVSYAPVFTHICEVYSNKSDLLVLLKRYSKGLRTLSLMGDKKEVKDLISRIETKTGKLENIPDPTNRTTVNKDLIIEFDYDELSHEELILFKKYYIG